MRLKFALSVILLLGALTQVSATQERLAGRIPAGVDERSRTIVQGHLHPLAQPRLDRGRVDPLVTLSRVTMMFKRTREQQAALDAFLQEQQDPSSRNYQLWLSPEEFADRFGLSADDIN